MSFNFSDWSLGASVAEAGWHLSQSFIQSTVRKVIVTAAG